MMRICTDIRETAPLGHRVVALRRGGGYGICRTLRRRDAVLLRTADEESGRECLKKLPWSLWVEPHFLRPVHRAPIRCLSATMSSSPPVE